MRRGKKSLSERIIYGALEIIAERTKDDPVKVFKKALRNVQPSLEVKSCRVGGANYQVPIEIRPRRQETLAMRWLIQYSRDRRRSGPCASVWRWSFSMRPTTRARR